MTPPELQNKIDRLQIELDEAKKETARLRDNMDQMQAAEGNRLDEERNAKIKAIEVTLRSVKNSDGGVSQGK
jgi:hypothetical protein